VKKPEAIQLFVREGWTKADAERAIATIDFKADPSELTLRKAALLFAGSELSHRQRLQAAQKGLVTKKTNELEQYKKAYAHRVSVPKPDLIEPPVNALALEEIIQALVAENKELLNVNDHLKKDNKALKNLVDEIRVKLAINTKQLLDYKDSEIRQALTQFLSWTLG
jgi:hypothetical protein